MDYYEKKRRAGISLAEWIKKEEREPFSAFVRPILSLYGFDVEFMKKLLETNYPGLTIKEDILERRPL